jgi:DNA-binding CsgD family transcriptional regulator
MTPAVGFFDPWLLLARAWLAAGSGELSRARALALEATERADMQGAHAVVVMALHDLVRLGDPRCSRLEQTASLVDGPFAPACVLHAAGLASRDGRRLDEAAAAFAAMGADLLAAEAAAQAAESHRAAGSKALMLASSARVRLHLEVCEGAQTPALSVLATPLLTPREREVAMLADTGLTSAEIAKRLVLSSRTVEGHLQRAYVKLGITGRNELRSVLRRPAPEDGAVRPASADKELSQSSRKLAP